VVLCASAGFVFGKYSFKGKTCLLGVALLTILIPRQVIALPLSEWLIQLQLYDSLWAIILPGTVTGIGLLFFAKMFRQVPEELLEVARTEGASELRVFFTVLPLVKSSLLTFAFIQFTMAWHEHLMPLLMLESDNETLPLALSSLLSSSLRFPRAVVMAGGFFMIVPTILLFIFLYRQIKSSLSELILHCQIMPR
jgi:ABC-type glycerol-3-phosphate transport system permease component